MVHNVSNGLKSILILLFLSMSVFSYTEADSAYFWNATKTNRLYANNIYNVNALSKSNDSGSIDIWGGIYRGTGHGSGIQVYGNYSSQHGNIAMSAGNGNGTTTGAISLYPRVYLGTRPSADTFQLKVDSINTPILQGNVITRGISSVDSLAVTKGMTVGRDIISTSATPIIRTNTNEGSDTKILNLCGGGGSSSYRGATIKLYGNQASVKPGVIELIPGDVANPYVYGGGKLSVGMKPVNYTDWALAVSDHLTLNSGGVCSGMQENVYYSSGVNRYRDGAYGAATRVNLTNGLTLQTSGKGTTDGAISWRGGIRLDTTGYVSINKTTNPTAPLDVAGLAKVDSATIPILTDNITIRGNLTSDTTHCSNIVSRTGNDALNLKDDNDINLNSQDIHINGRLYQTGDGYFTEGYTQRFDCPTGQTYGTGSNVTTPLQIYQPTTGAPYTVGDAALSFQILGKYAVYFGLDNTTNDLFVGGWSMGANKYKVWHAGNLNPASYSLTSHLLTDHTDYGTYFNQAVKTTSDATLNTLTTSDYLQATGMLYLRNDVSILNKAGNGWLTFADRNTAGSEAVYDLSNIGSIQIGTSSPISGNFYLDDSVSATITGMSSPTTVMVSYCKVGKQVTLSIPAINGTSDATTFSLSGLPSAIRPVNSQWNQIPPKEFFDNGNYLTDMTRVEITSAGVINFLRLGTNWTASGIKGFEDGLTISYILK